MALICKERGCGKGLKTCRCGREVRRRWQADVWVHVEGEAKFRRKQIGSPERMTRAEAQVWFGGLKHDAGLPAENWQIIVARAPAPAKPAQRTFDEADKQLVRELDAEVASGTTRRTTYRNHASILRFHLRPQFSGKTLSEIDVAAVKEFRLKLMSSKLRSRTQRGILSTLGMVLGMAVENCPWF